MHVKIRSTGSGYTARAGRGRKAKTASCTASIHRAAQMAAAKYFGLDASNTVKPADLRIIGSSTQFSIEFNGYEAWANFPHEQARMLNLIKETKANGVLFLSGDVHYAELSKLQYPGLYPIYDLTSSGLSSTWDFATPNRNRIKGPVMENHFGMVTIDWQKADPLIQLEIKDVPGKQRILHQLKLSELQLK